MHRTKRLWRFVAHQGLDESGLTKRLTRLSISVCRSAGLLLPVIIDLTYFNSFAVFSASVPRSGRALPIAWRVFSRNLDDERVLSQNHLIEGVLLKMRERLAKAIKPIIIGDREFARASLFRWLIREDMHFVIRVDAETWVLHPSYSGPLSGLVIRPGGPRIWLPATCYGKEEQVPVNLLAMWSMGQREPWCISSDLNDPSQIERLYRKRMKIEHGFRDWKHQLRLKGTAKVRSAGSMGRLISAVIVLYWYVCLIAVRLKGHPCTVEVQAWGRLGECKLGIELLELDSKAVSNTAQRLILWARDKLFALATHSFLQTPLPPLPPSATSNWVMVSISDCV